MNIKMITVIGFLMLTPPVFAAPNDTATQGLSAMSTQSLEQNKQTGESFLTANKTKPGVVTLADGLQYKILKPGDGEKPTPNDIVTVEYEGKLINGKEFDNSAKHGGPASFGVDQVIPGWTEVLQLMPVGSIWEIYIPSRLAYGDQGAPPVIGPGETLIFKVKLLGIKKENNCYKI